MGPIHGPSDSFLWVIGILAACGLCGIAYGGYELVVYILQHIKIV